MLPRTFSIIASAEDTYTLLNKTDDVDDDQLQPFPIDGFITMVMALEKILSFQFEALVQYLKCAETQWNIMQ